MEWYCEFFVMPVGIINHYFCDCFEMQRIRRTISLAKQSQLWEAGIVFGLYSALLNSVAMAAAVADRLDLGVCNCCWFVLLGVAGNKWRLGNIRQRCKVGVHIHHTQRGRPFRAHLL